MILQPSAARLVAGLASFMALWNAVNATPSVPVAYCASINTAGMAANNSDFQSDGLCSDFCRRLNGGFALAIIQAKSCWCSDYIPDTGAQVDTDNCQNSCPGYPSDFCGGDDLFGYMALSKAAAGTTGASSPTTPVPGPGTTPSPSVDPSTQTPSVETVTVGGTVRTVTASPTGTAVPDSTTAPSSSGLPVGAAVGIVIGVIAAIALIAIGLWVWCVRRKKADAELDGPFESPSQRGSSAGMLGSTKTNEVSESRYVGSDGRSAAENWEGGHTRRSSGLMPVDPRLDPFGLYGRMQNKSHDSVNTIQDHQDYSRKVHEPTKVLRATNPDPDMEE